ncbi:MAG: hypothetical protein G01um1014106_129 [Parcubacteria group bacterium Gr01-1014_106]|nr:MAG: hypothetical protein G01um1014106_129 [Parcubacteria group bacterium Gr01-1014_106]
MLVLVRKKDESIVVGAYPPLAVIRILVATRGRARLGIEADHRLPVDRLEVYLQKFGDPFAARLRAPDCPPLEQLARYARSSAGFEEARPEHAAIRAHVQQCPGCREDFRSEIPWG